MYETIPLYQGHSINLVFIKVEVDEDTGVETPVDWDGNHTIVVYLDPAHLMPVMTFTEASGAIEKSGNVMTATKSKGDNNLTPNEYFISIHNDLDGETSYEEAQAKILLIPSRKLP